MSKPDELQFQINYRLKGDPTLHTITVPDLRALVENVDTLKALEGVLSIDPQIVMPESQRQAQQMQAQFTEMGKYHLVLDSGYPELVYCADGDDEGVFVAHVDSGDSLTSILQKATEHMLGGQTT